MVDYERLSSLKYKKDNGYAMSGHEQMELHYLTELIILEDKLKEAIKCLKHYRNYSKVVKTLEYLGEKL